MSEMNQKIRDALAQARIEQLPYVRFAFWANKNRRDGRNDAQFSGRVQVSTVRCIELLAEALKEGKTEIELWANLWQNTPNELKPDAPVMSGASRKLVVPIAAEDSGGDVEAAAG